MVASACGSAHPARPEVTHRPSSPAAPAASAAPAVDPPQPSLRLPRNFVPTGYRARLAVDPAKTGFTGAIEISGDITERSKGLWLHGRGLAVSEATATQGDRAIRVDVTTAGEDLLALRPVTPLEPGPVTLALAYTGAFEAVDGTGAYRKTVGGAVYIQTQFEDISARRVFPCIDEPDRKVPWQLTLDVPKDQVAGSPPTSSRDSTAGSARRSGRRPER